MEIRQKIDKILGNTLAFIMAIMVVNVLWQVFTRFVVGTPSSFTDELARYLMIWVGVLGAAYISGRKMHVAIDLFPAKLNKEGQAKLKVFVNILIILFCFGALIVGGIRLVYITYTLEQYSAALQIPLALVYLVIPISGVLIIFYKISDIFNKQVL
ncbi:TRAP transporter small permease [Flavicella sediminum]|uniref:TRAP transporter small permease n=1 Tax=Flavicella sediminum TaxID=2585141 RepID=UPI001120D924|nr:TRAP transporter small permease [Flavicella sediminum]